MTYPRGRRCKADRPFITDYDSWTIINVRPLSPPVNLSPHRILSVAEDELSRIVLDIHDGPVQYLFTAPSLLTGIQNDLAGEQVRPDIEARMAQVGTLLESSLYEIKFFLGTFRPPEFRNRPLSFNHSRTGDSA